MKIHRYGNDYVSQKKQEKAIETTLPKEEKIEKIEDVRNQIPEERPGEPGDSTQGASVDVPETGTQTEETTKKDSKKKKRVSLEETQELPQEENGSL